ncbi:helix-turn-helix domain-containing protein [Aerococcus agrisoli]|uniref:Helix-turn-helix domain-containing protein n=1 Tax=Aerococcus agrisoli TaxID=2487350 RepID=A0A3N4FZ43_9LACT|nr:helix-turn-helix domain-containing protein [Aerococcus agrisoli]RPA55515.1 helix-turn-helix domain-containing protein [Aerococcus agrisoli]
MSKRVKLSADEKLAIIKPILGGCSSLRFVSKEMNLHGSVIQTWIRKYKADGFEGLVESKTWKRYSKNLKKMAVEDVVFRGYSKNSTVKKYHISSFSVLQRWINLYNSGKELKSTSMGRSKTTMTKGRKTTFEERLEITQFTIARDNDYDGATEKYGVSYQQIYSWVKKYQLKGSDGLKDLRGQNKPENELTDTERLKFRIKELEARNEYLEMQKDIEKKLLELNQRYDHFR